MKKLFKHIGEILLVVGGFIATYNIFNFDSSYYGGGKTIGGLPSLELQIRESTNPTTFYYYKNDTLILLSLGVALIILGILIIRAKKNK